MSDLGQARGRIVIDTAGVRTAQQEVQSASQAMNRALNAIGFGVGAREVIQYATAAEAVATAYRRQLIAARSLAGSQGQLNTLLDVYNRATGDAIDKARALSDVTLLMSTGFADSAQELDQFVRAVRGISIATGRPQEFIVTQLQFELLNQTGFRLDQIGLSMQEVKQRADELRVANSALTSQQAYQQAVIETANRKFGALTQTAEAQATEVEKLRKAWKDFQLEFGAGSGGGVVNSIASGATAELEGLHKMLLAIQEDLRRAREEYGREVGPWPIAQAIENFFQADPLGDFLRDAPDRFGPSFRDPVPSWMTSSNTPLAPSGGPAIDIRERNAIITDWWREVQDIERQAAADRLDATRQYEQQRSSVIRTYQQSIAREAQSFAIQRQRAEEDYARSVARVREDAVRREIEQAQELERTIARARQDSSERLADLQSNFDRTVAQRRVDNQERLAEWEEDRGRAVEERRREGTDRILELEEDFARDRVRAQAQFQVSLEEAAARGDARSVYRLQQRFDLENEEVNEAHRERIADEKTKLQEAIDQLNEAHQERVEDEKRALNKSISQAKEAFGRQVADEKEALDKRIAQAQEAYNLQLEAAREADAQRLEEMEADFAQRKLREDQDRAIRLGQMAQDHQQQLTELSNQHSQRLSQIRTHAAEERAAVDEEFQTALADLGIQTDAWIEENKRITDKAIEEFDRFWENLTKKVTTPPATPGNDPLTEGGTEASALAQERASIYQQLQGLERNTPLFDTLIKRLNAVENRMRELGILEGSPASISAAMATSASALMASSRFTMPTPMAGIAATGTSGGGTSITIAPGAITVYGAPGQSETGLANLIDQRILETVRKAASA